MRFLSVHTTILGILFFSFGLCAFAAVGTFTQDGVTYYDTSYGRALARTRRLEKDAQSAKRRADQARIQLTQNISELARLMQKAAEGDKRSLEKIKQLFEQAQQAYFQAIVFAYTSPPGDRSVVAQAMRDQATAMDEIVQQTHVYRRQVVFKASVEALDKVIPEFQEVSNAFVKYAQHVENTINSPATNVREYLEIILSDKTDAALQAMAQDSQLNEQQLMDKLQPVDDLLAQTSRINDTATFAKTEAQNKDLRTQVKTQPTRANYESLIANELRLAEAAMYFMIVEQSEDWLDVTTENIKTFGEDIIEYAQLPNIPASSAGTSSKSTGSKSTLPKQEAKPKPAKTRRGLF